MDRTRGRLDGNRTGDTEQTPLPDEPWCVCVCVYSSFEYSQCCCCTIALSLLVEVKQLFTLNSTGPYGFFARPLFLFLSITHTHMTYTHTHTCMNFTIFTFLLTTHRPPRLFRQPLRQERPRRSREGCSNRCERSFIFRL